MADRHQFRAQWHDYNGGIYFVTVCAYQKLQIFGEIIDGQMVLSQLGFIIEQCLCEIPKHHPLASVLNHVVMPNHIHFVIAVGTRYIASAQTSTPTVQATTISNSPITSTNSLGCLGPPRHGEICEDFHHNADLPIIIGTFKAAVTRLARTRCIASLPCWQPRYHEHIIRNQHAFANIMNYLDTNVANWHQDCFNPVGTRYIAYAHHSHR